ncbi:MAG: cyclic nucleotide-binding domain-containing protein [Dehalococcoidia bacterium]
MDVLQALARIPLFRQMSQEYLERLGRVARERHFKAGDVILHEGNPGIAFFGIASGNVEVVRGSGGDESVINNLGPGGSFGEMALLTELPRMATVRAVDDVTCIAMSRLDFLDALRDQPEIAIQLLKTLAELLRQAEERAQQTR